MWMQYECIVLQSNLCLLFNFFPKETQQFKLLHIHKL